MTNYPFLEFIILKKTNDTYSNGSKAKKSYLNPKNTLKYTQNKNDVEQTKKLLISTRTHTHTTIKKEEKIELKQTRIANLNKTKSERI